MGFKLGSARRSSSSRLNAQANIAPIISAAFLNTSPYSIDYLIVGGGGGGGSTNGGSFAGGGGGGGGFISGTATATYGNTYIITIGAGGTTIGANTPTTGYTEATANGSNTILFGNSISLNAFGGGYGGAAAWTFPTTIPSPAPAIVNNGRTGNAATGGGSIWNAAAAAGRAIGSPALNVVGTQGWPGGGSGGGGSAGGGGGSGSAGGTTPPSPTAPGAAGGLGNVWTLTGPTIRYAGGGAGGSQWVTANVIAFGGNVSPSTALLKGGGGDGGGGLGNFNGTNGTNNTGGGGGGGMGGGPPPGTVNYASGGAGGSGLVKIAMPSIVYPAVSYTGSVTVEQSATSPEKTIITFNSSGTLTA